MFLWESFLLGAFGAVASAVVGAMAAGVFSFAQIDLPFPVQLAVLSDTCELADLPSALGGAIALITIVTGGRALALRAFRARG